MARKIASLELTVKDQNNNTFVVVVDKYPKLCPACDRGTNADYIDAYGQQGSYDQSYHVEGIFKCTFDDCQAVFIAAYASPVGAGRLQSEYVFLKNCYIRFYSEPLSFPDEIEKLSPMYVEIFTQAKSAEDMGLDKICGAGYRKALEFLLKDFLNLVKPELKKELDKHMLGYVIANYLEEGNIQKVAGLANDIGNDETHYVKKIEKLTLEDMKKLVKMTTSWLVLKLSTDEYAPFYKKLMLKNKK